ncbi:MAG: gliding motility protein GldG [Ignavibacteriae bacterium]|nr:MAG: gliding motility protein GldG [Ignavibacteriota bacterium]
MKKTKQQIIFQTILIIGIVVFINIISVRVFTRLDLTSSKAYSLSEASKDLVRSLDDKFLVKAYFTADLPAPYNNHRRFLQDQLDDYKAYSKGNFQYEFIDPSKNQELEQEAQRYNIPPVQVQVIKDDKLQIEKAYMGLVFLYGDKQENIQVVKNLDKLEYEISSKIKKLTSNKQIKIGIASGHGEPDFEKLKQFRELLAEQYNVVSVNIKNGNPIPDDISALLIIAPREKFSDADKYVIDQYLMKGGKIAFFINQIDATLQSQMGQTLNINLDDLYETYGFKIRADMVRDARCANVTISQQAGFMTIQSQIPYPYLPIASEYNPKNIVVKNLGPVIFHFVSSIDTSLANAKGLHLEVLLTSSNKSGRMEGFFIINPTLPFTQDMFKESYIPLAISVEGNFKSHYADREPQIDSTSNISIADKLTNSSKTKIVVVGDGDFIQDSYIGTRDNLVFATNLIDWLVDDIGLTTIRSKDIAVKPLEEVSDGTRTFVKSINLVLPPLIMIVTGIIRWRLKVSRRKRIEMSI